MNTSLAITISPPNRIKGTKVRNPNRNMFDEDRKNIKSIFKYNRIKRYIVFPEFDVKGRLHYHGVLTLDSNERIRFYKHAMHKLALTGFVDIKPLNDFLGHLRWLCYIKKQWHITKQVLEISRPIANVKLLCQT